MINICSEECNDASFCKHICKPKNVIYLNKKDVIYPHVADIVQKYLEEDEENFEKIKKKLIKNKNTFQFVYSSVYPEFYSFVEKQGIELKSEFHLKFKEWKDNKKYFQKSIDSYISKRVNSPPPPLGVIQKKLIHGEDFEKEKKLAEEQKQKKWRKKRREKET